LFCDKTNKLAVKKAQKCEKQKKERKEITLGKTQLHLKEEKKSESGGGGTYSVYFLRPNQMAWP